MKIQMTDLTEVTEEGSGNPVAKTVLMLLSHLRAVSYVLVIVTVYLISLSPFFAFHTFNTIDNL